jgi:hypothetical protein
VPNVGARANVGLRLCENPKSHFQMNDKIRSKTEVKSKGFAPYGTALKMIL